MKIKSDYKGYIVGFKAYIEAANIKDAIKAFVTHYENYRIPEYEVSAKEVKNGPKKID